MIPPNQPFLDCAPTQAGEPTHGTFVFGGYKFLKKGIGQNHTLSVEKSVNLINLDIFTILALVSSLKYQ
jgi:hypothetical protein